MSGHPAPKWRRGITGWAVMLSWTLTPMPALACKPTRENQRAYLERLEHTAILGDFNGRLLTSASATRVLEEWCASHKLADNPQIIARRISEGEKPATPETRERLGVGPSEQLRHRQVELVCGVRVLSVADNWYVPGRLTTEMNAALDTSDTPFGRVVAPLGTSRRTISVEHPWQPLAPGWEMHSVKANQCRYRAPELALTNVVLQHRALVLDSRMRPIAEVIESYTAANLIFNRGN